MVSSCQELFPETVSHCVALANLELCVDQDALELTEVCLPQRWD